jgi:hypothetical protein
MLSGQINAVTGKLANSKYELHVWSELVRYLGMQDVHSSGFEQIRFYNSKVEIIELL